jgi:hypothetical protein
VLGRETCKLIKKTVVSYVASCAETTYKAALPPWSFEIVDPIPSAPDVLLPSTGFMACLIERRNVLPSPDAP